MWYLEQVYTKSLFIVCQNSNFTVCLYFYLLNLAALLPDPLKVSLTSQHQGLCVPTQVPQDGWCACF